MVLLVQCRINYVLVINVHQAIYPFKPQAKDDLELLSGDIIEVATVSADDWGQGVCLRTGITGSFPWNYVEKSSSDAPAPPPIQRTTKPHSYENVPGPDITSASSSKVVTDFSSGSQKITCFNA